MKKILLSFAVALLCSAGTQAQRHRTCSTHEKYLQAVSMDPSILEQRSVLEQQTQEWVANNASQRSNGTNTVLVTIPVVVHVLYQNATQNISDAQILSQIEVLNADYAHRNADSTITPAAFQPLMANTQIQFCMASTDPSGNLTNGIERRQVSVSQIGNTSKYYQYSQGGLAAWNRNSYLNFWICDIDGGWTLGFAYLPGTAGAAYDGVVIDYNFFGTIGTAQAPFNLGRTATHEVGHYLNLEHIWADESACNADDGVTDTPQQKGENYGCPSYPQTSQSGGRCNASDPSSMFMNYMDYTDDACMAMFTPGQGTRMQAGVTSGRPGLLTSIGCSVPTSILSPGGKIGLTIYPNPSAGEFEFTTGFINSQTEIQVTDIAGRVVLEKTFMPGDRLSFDLTQSPAGSYFVDVKADGHREVKQVTKF